VPISVAELAEAVLRSAAPSVVAQAASAPLARIHAVSLAGSRILPLISCFWQSYSN